jgi:hypothetical protein
VRITHLANAASPELELASSRVDLGRHKQLANASARVRFGGHEFESVSSTHVGLGQQPASNRGHSGRPSGLSNESRFDRLAVDLGRQNTLTNASIRGDFGLFGLEHAISGSRWPWLATREQSRSFESTLGLPRTGVGYVISYWFRPVAREQSRSFESTFGFFEWETTTILSPLASVNGRGAQTPCQRVDFGPLVHESVVPTHLGFGPTAASNRCNSRRLRSPRTRVGNVCLRRLRPKCGEQSQQLEKTSVFSSRNRYRPTHHGSFGHHGAG